MSDLTRLRDAVSADVHGQATDADRALLDSDPDGWRDVLHELIADVGRQVEYRQAALDQALLHLTGRGADAERERHAEWLRKATGFRTLCEKRLAELEHETAARRRRALDRAHRALAAAVADLVAIEDVHHLAGDVVIDAADLRRVAGAYEQLLDAATGQPAGVLVSSDL